MVTGRVQQMAQALMRANHAVGCSYIEDIAMDRSSHNIDECLAPVRAHHSLFLLIRLILFV